MAIISNVEASGITLNNAYTKISTVNYISYIKPLVTMGRVYMDENNEPQMEEDTIEYVKEVKIKYQADTYGTQATRDANGEILFSKVYDFKLENLTNSINPLDEAYAELKRKESYENAVDA